MGPVRHPLPQEREAVAALWRQCFPEDSAAYVTWYFDTVYEARNTLALFDGPHLCSSLQLNPYPLRLRGRTLHAAAMAGVDTDPAYRRQGLAGKLIRAAFALLRERGQAVSFLFPFRESFYEVYGYTCSYLRQVGRVGASALPGLRPGIAREMPLDAETAAALMPPYRAWADGREGMVARDEALMARRLADCAVDGSRCVALLGPAEPQAYALFYVEGEEVILQEQATTPAQAGELLAAVAQACPGVKRLQATAAERWPVPGMAWEAAHGDMLRVVDVAAALTGLDAPEGLALTLRVSDDICPWNDGGFALRSRGGRLVAGPAQGRAEASLDVRTLARLLTGYETVGEAVAAGGLQADAAAQAALEGLFPPSVPEIVETY